MLFVSVIPKLIDPKNVQYSIRESQFGVIIHCSQTPAKQRLKCLYLVGYIPRGTVQHTIHSSQLTHSLWHCLSTGANHSLCTTFVRLLTFIFMSIFSFPIADNIDNDGVDASCLVDSVWMLFDDNYSDDSGESIESVGGLLFGTVALLRRITANTWLRKRLG